MSVTFYTTNHFWHHYQNVKSGVFVLFKKAAEQCRIVRRLLPFPIILSMLYEYLINP